MGACFEVYKELHCGLYEPIYQEALILELKAVDFMTNEHDLSY